MQCSEHFQAVKFRKDAALVLPPTVDCGGWQRNWPQRSSLRMHCSADRSIRLNFQRFSFIREVFAITSAYLRPGLARTIHECTRALAWSLFAHEIFLVREYTRYSARSENPVCKQASAQSSRWFM